MNRADGEQGGAGVTSMRLSYEELRGTLARFEYFRHWTEEQVRECSVLAQVVQYAPQQTIPLELPLPCAVLVLSGQCMILQCLPVVRGAGRRRDQLRLERDEPAASTSPPDGPLEQIHRWRATFRARVAECGTAAPGSPGPPYDPDRATAYVQTPPPERRTVLHFLDVGSFRCGAVFGLGECHRQRTVVARTRTQCLLIPRRWLFLTRQNVGNTWQRLRMYLDWQLPTRDALLDQFRHELAWRRYRRRLVAHAPKRPSRTHPSDVPIVCRLAEATWQP